MSKLIDVYDSDASLKTPILKYTTNVIDETDPVLISKRAWFENNTTTTYCRYQYWKRLNFSKGTKGITKTFNVSYKIGIQKSTVVETAKKLNINVGVEKTINLSKEFSKKLQTSISFTEEYTYTQVSNISQSNNDWIWAIWQLVELFEISTVKHDNLIEKVAAFGTNMLASTIDDKMGSDGLANAFINKILEKNQKDSNIISIVNFTQNTHEALDYDNN